MGMPDNDKLKGYIAELEQVIRKMMEDSDEIAQLVAKIQEEGIQVTLNFLALFFDPSGNPFFLKHGAELAEADSEWALPSLGGASVRREPRLNFKITDEDHDFLREIGLRFDDEDE